ncbi:MAG TPA: NAD(P)-binding domain-containing protein [Promineifilum sp.]|nr:NAD(P)-binding domain-containing protein [Promineifilum sp.]HQF71700.1 NAD(P)-binding domain-containing protein [Promineifilum sp.]
MNVGILGSGAVGQALGSKMAELGHDVVLGTRDPANVDETKGYAPSLGEWLASVDGAARLGTFAEAAAHGELIVNALNGLAAVETLLPLAASLAGKVIIDITNPLDFSRGMPPSVLTYDGASLAEAIQQALPDARVVKSLNTLTAALMVNPRQLAGGDHTVFVAGDDAAAKAEVSELLRTFGWSDILDMGGLAAARGLELWLPLWLQLFGVLGRPSFNLKIVR